MVVNMAAVTAMVVGTGSCCKAAAKHCQPSLESPSGEGGGDRGGACVHAQWWCERQSHRLGIGVHIHNVRTLVVEGSSCTTTWCIGASKALLGVNPVQSILRLNNLCHLQHVRCIQAVGMCEALLASTFGAPA